jgi:quercetin dioxygenase-like cupin family protein
MTRSAFTTAATSLLIALGLSAVALGGCSNDSATADAVTAPSAEPIVRQLLGETSPSNAPGQTLYLERVSIAPGTQLSQHFHEGTQVAYVEAGTLTYTMVSGTVVVTDADGVATSHTGPTVVTIEPGSWLVETPEVIHYGENAGTETVEIILTALLAEGAPLATPSP